MAAPTSRRRLGAPRTPPRSRAPPRDAPRTKRVHHGPGCPTHQQTNTRARTGIAPRRQNPRWWWFVCVGVRSGAFFERFLLVFWLGAGRRPFGCQRPPTLTPERGFPVLVRYAFKKATPKKKLALTREKQKNTQKAQKHPQKTQKHPKKCTQKAQKHPQKARKKTSNVFALTREKNCPLPKINRFCWYAQKRPATPGIPALTDAEDAGPKPFIPRRAAHFEKAEATSRTPRKPLLLWRI